MLSLTAALGLLRLPDFFQRMHAPALAYTLGAWCVTLASIVYFSALDGELALHAWLIVILLSHHGADDHGAARARRAVPQAPGRRSRAAASA